MKTTIRRRLGRALAVSLSFGLLATPALLSQPAQAAVKDPKYRKVLSPNVFYPVKGARTVKDLKNFSRKHRGTDIRAKCGAAVFATHPGTAVVQKSTRWASRYVVRVTSGSRGLVTSAAYLSRPTVQNGQIIQAGQQIGNVGRHTKRTPCGIYFSVNNRGKVYNPTSWLKTYVGKPAPISTLFGDTGFNLASFNLLGASHTGSGSRYPAYTQRTDRAIRYIEAKKLDVVGTQEFQGKQFDLFMKTRGLEASWDSCYGLKRNNKTRDTENAIILRRSTTELLDCQTIDVPYFDGNIRRMPVAHIKIKASGLDAYFINVHNPATLKKYGNQTKWRRQAIAIERNKVIELRETGRPVFLTGDFNDGKNAFCPLTAQVLMISPNSVPSSTCRYPTGQGSIDWIFAAGQTRFSSFQRDRYPRNAKFSDHPAIIARTHLQS